jgi:hypothetical protein
MRRTYIPCLPRTARSPGSAVAAAVAAAADRRSAVE